MAHVSVGSELLLSSHPGVGTCPGSATSSRRFRVFRGKAVERVRKGSGDGGWVGGCGTLGRPRDSELGQDAERVGAKT